MVDPSPIDVVEAAYWLGEDRQAWLRGVLEAAEPLLQPCTFVGGYFIDTSSVEGGPIDGLMTLRGPNALAELVKAFHRDVPNASRMAWEQGARGAALASELLPSLGAWSGFQQLGQIQASIGVPMRDLLGVTGLDAAGRGVFLGCGYDQPARLDRTTRARWTRVGVHLAAGERLRRALAARSTPAEAILTPSARVEHAEGDAKTPRALESLRTQAVAIDRARGRQRKRDPDAALEAWRGLVSGRWSLVDRFESDGRRYLVAHRNEAAAERRLALTLRERQVLGHVLLGHSSKVIAYTLGVSAAAVAGVLRTAMQKLGVRSRAQLMGMFGIASGAMGP